MLKVHSKIGKFLVYFMFFVSFFGSLALFEDQILHALRPNLSGVNITKAYEYLLDNYTHSSTLSIKELEGGGYLLAHFEPKDSKKIKKASQEFYGANGPIAYFKTDFFKALHFKFFPTDGLIKQLGKAASSLIAILLIIVFISGLLVLKIKQLFKLSSPKPRGRLHLAHVNFGILAGVFLCVFCLSGIGLNYLNDIDQALAKKPTEASLAKKSTAKKPPEASVREFKLSQVDKERLMDNLNAVIKDAKSKLQTNHLEIINSNRGLFIVRPANEFKSRLDGKINANLLIYKGDKLLKASTVKDAGLLSRIYNFFYDIHRLHAASLWLKELICLASLASCAFMIYALKLSAFAKPFNYQAIFLSSSIATFVYLLALKFELAQIGLYGFYISFLLSFIAARFISAKASKFIAFGALGLIALIIWCEILLFNVVVFMACMGLLNRSKISEIKQS